MRKGEQNGYTISHAETLHILIKQVKSHTSNRAALSELLGWLK